MLRTLVIIVVGWWGVEPAISRPMPTTEGVLCAMTDRVGDCPCAITFLRENLPSEDALIMLELWASSSSHPRRPMASELAERYGEAVTRATLAFHQKLTAFQAACPTNRLVLDDDDPAGGDVPDETPFSGLSRD